MPYVRQQSVREEAGLQSEVLAESIGTGNGSQTVFVTAFKPLADRGYDDAVNTTTDVVVYVNGLPVTISSINTVAGAITLAVAPANGAAVTADYAYSPVKDTFVNEVIEEVQDLIDERMGDAGATVPYTTVPKSIRLIARLWAAGLLLTRDYGLNSDITDTSKDGYKKIETASAMLDRYASHEEAQTAEGSDQPSVNNEGLLMSRIDADGNYRPPLNEENFSFTSDSEDDTGW